MCFRHQKQPRNAARRPAISISGRENHPLRKVSPPAPRRQPAKGKIAFGLLLVLLAGCGQSGPELAPAQGVVLLDDRPLSDAAVTFQPVDGGPVASGVTDAKGRFSLQTTNRPGALVGEHRVTIVKQEMSGINPDGTAGPGGMQIEWKTPEKYARPETSPLTATVGGSEAFRFELVSGKD
jgi:hypothetical protein